jgi:hypothetical protein
MLTSVLHKVAVQIKYYAKRSWQQPPELGVEQTGLPVKNYACGAICIPSHRN